MANRFPAFSTVTSADQKGRPERSPLCSTSEINWANLGQSQIMPAASGIAPENHFWLPPPESTTVEYGENRLSQPWTVRIRRVTPTISHSTPICATAEIDGANRSQSQSIDKSRLPHPARRHIWCVHWNV